MIIFKFYIDGRLCICIHLTENTGDPYFWLLRKENSNLFHFFFSQNLFIYQENAIFIIKRENEKNHSYPLSGPLPLITENKINVVVIGLIVAQLAQNYHSKNNIGLIYLTVILITVMCCLSHYTIAMNK